MPHFIIKMDTTALDANWHLRSEISRLLSLLGRVLALQRNRGRTPETDGIRNFVIETGEAEGLLRELAEHWDKPRTRIGDSMPPAPTPHSELASLIDSAAAEGAYLPLRQTAEAFELTPLEYDAVLLALATEVDGRFGRLNAYLNDHIAHTRPPLGLALSLEEPETQKETLSPLVFSERPIVRDGLIDLEGEGHCH